MNPNDVFGEALEQLGTIPKQMGQSVKGAPGAAVATVTAQVSGNGQASNVPSTDALPQAQEASKSAEKPDDLLEMFGKSDLSPEQLDGVKTQKQMEDQQQLQALRQRLHSEYYQKLITPTPKPEENERPAERVERLEMQDLEEEKKKEQEKTPIAVARARSSAENKVAGAG